MTKVLLKQLPHAEGLPLPDYQTEGAAGADLVAALPEHEPVVLEPGAKAMIPTGLQIALPPRSGPAQVLLLSMPSLWSILRVQWIVIIAARCAWC